MKNEYFGNAIDEKIPTNKLEFYKPGDEFSARTLNRPIRANYEDLENIYNVLQNVCKTLYGQKENGILPDIYEEMNAEQISVGHFFDKKENFIRIPTGAFLAKLNDEQAKYYATSFEESNQYSRDFFISDDRSAITILNRPNLELFERQLAEHFNIDLNDQDENITMHYECYTPEVEAIEDPYSDIKFKSERNQRIRYYLTVDTTKYDYKTKENYSGTVVTRDIESQRIPINSKQYCNNVFEVVDSVNSVYRNYLTKEDNNFSLEEIIPINSDWAGGKYIIFFNPTKYTNVDDFEFSPDGNYGIANENNFEKSNDGKFIKLFSVELTFQIVDEDSVGVTRCVASDCESFLQKIDRTTLDIKNINLTNTINKLVFERTSKNSINISEAHEKDGENNISIGLNNLGYTGSDPTLVEQRYKENTGKDNISIGTNAMKNISNPESNIAIGKDSLTNIGSGKNNIEIGSGNGKLKNVNNNINIGNNISSSDSVGDSNIILGNNNDAKSVGNKNTLLGNNGSKDSTISDSNIILGNNKKININNNNIIIGENDSIELKDENYILGSNNSGNSDSSKNYIFGSGNKISGDNNIIISKDISDTKNNNIIIGCVNEPVDNDNEVVIGPLSVSKYFDFEDDIKTEKDSNYTIKIGDGNLEARFKKAKLIGEVVEFSGEVKSEKYITQSEFGKGMWINEDDTHTIGIPISGNIKSIDDIDQYKTLIGSDGNSDFISIRKNNGKGDSFGENSNNGSLIYLENDRLNYKKQTNGNWNESRQFIDNTGDQTINGTLAINDKLSANSLKVTNDSELSTVSADSISVTNLTATNTVAAKEVKSTNLTVSEGDNSLTFKDGKLESKVSNNISLDAKEVNISSEQNGISITHKCNTEKCDGIKLSTECPSGKASISLNQGKINLASADTTINSAVNINGDITTEGALTTSKTVTAESFNAVSARALKKNIKPTKHNAIEEINKVEIVDFYFKTDTSNSDPKIGFIADDTDEIFSSKEKNKMDIYNCVGMLLKAVQELSSENKELKAKIAKLGV